jgi:hypothetical protein
MKTRLSLSIAGPLAVIILGLAALCSPTDWWASVVFTAALSVLSLAALNLAYRRGRRRAFWSAFVAFGFGYLALAFGPWCETAIRPRLLTTKLLSSAYPLLHRPDEVAIPRRASRVDSGVGTKPIYFQDIGHSLAALLLAGSGGLAARRFYATRDERKREAAEKAAGIVVKALEAGL